MKLSKGKVKDAKKSINKTIKKLKSKKLLKKLTTEGNKLLESIKGKK